MKQSAPASASTPADLADGLLALRRHPLLNTVERAMRQRCGINGGERILLGVSGGADSIALLLVCRVLRDRGRSDGFRVEPIVAHIHHHLRGSAADDDEQFVTELCRTLGVESFIEHIEPGAHPGSVAANARTLRYQALERRAKECSASAVAVAHHADDQLETMIMALCRGTGVDGLSGMRWRRRLEGGTPLARPLLGIRRSECEELCRAAGVAWRDDATNLDPHQPRARLRRDVIPVLEELWPDAARRSTACAEQLNVASNLVEEALARSFSHASRRRWDRDALRSLPAALISAGLRRAAVALKPEAGDDLPHRVLHLAAEAVRDDDRKPRRFSWPAGLEVVVTALEVRLDEA